MHYSTTNDPQMACPARSPMMGGTLSGRFKNCPAYFTDATAADSQCVGDNGGHEFISSYPGYNRGSCIPSGTEVLVTEEKWNQFKNQTDTRGLMQKDVVQKIIDKWQAATPDADPDFLAQYSHPTANNLQVYNTLVDDCSGFTTTGCPQDQAPCPKVKANAGPNELCSAFYNTSNLISDNDTRNTLRNEIYQKSCDQCHASLGGKDVSLADVNASCPGCACILRDSISEYQTLRDEFKKQFNGIVPPDKCWYKPCAGLSDDAKNTNMIMNNDAWVQESCPSNQICQQLNQFSVGQDSTLNDVTIAASCKQNSSGSGDAPAAGGDTPAAGGDLTPAAGGDTPAGGGGADIQPAPSPGQKGHPFDPPSPTPSPPPSSGGGSDFSTDLDALERQVADTLHIDKQYALLAMILGLILGVVVLTLVAKLIKKLL